MHSIFDPQSPQARAVTTLWWWMFGVGGAIWLGVVVTMLYVAVRRRGERGAAGLMHVPPATHKRMERVVAGAGFATVLVLLGFLVFDFSVGHAIAIHPSRGITIDITGHQWWWEVQYEDPDPSKRIATANEIHVPTGEMIQFKLRAADVIHSFWVPNLQGKRDLIPGYVSTQWFRADTAGVYRGQCAEFCGLEHAKMALYIIAEPPAKFAAWMAAASQPHEQPTDSTLLYGQRVFMTAGCSACHSIAGTQAMGMVGPGLSHFKSRMTIGSGTLANTRRNLEAWVANPHDDKPGVLMPRSALSQVQLDALVNYLETLK